VLKVTRAAKDHNLACLMPSFFPQVKAHLDLGFTMVMTAFDALILTKGLRESLATGHTMLEEWKKEQKGEVEGEKEKEKNGN